MSSRQQNVPTAEQVLAGLFGSRDRGTFVVDGQLRVVQGPPLDARSAVRSSQPETCYRRWAGSDTPCAGCPVEQVLRTGQARVAEVQVGCEDRWYEVHASPVAAAEGTATHALIVAFDHGPEVLTAENLLAAYGGHMHRVGEDGTMLLADPCCDEEGHG